MEEGARRCWVEIDLAALQHNLQQVRQRCGTAKVMAVIKANGYGHDMLTVAQALHTADEFAVTDIDELFELRSQGFQQAITLLSGRLSEDDFNALAEQNARPVIYDVEQLDALRRSRKSNRFDLWLKVDTGMGRLGFTPDEIAKVFEELETFPQARSVSIMTHLANADNPKRPENKQQFQTLSTLLQEIEPASVSVLNSAGVFAFPDHAHDVVRPGLALYGVSALNGLSAAQLHLRPAMSFKARLLSIAERETGATIGYGSVYVLPRSTRVGIIACGYADGYPRHMPSMKTKIVLNGQLVPLIGRVSMDMIAVDLGDLHAQPGDVATLWGDKLPIEEIADLADTIPYELLCSITQRVARRIVSLDNQNQDKVMDEQ